jgi:hypothetical protein
MNRTERAALVRDQHATGVQHGINTARVIIENFPNGFTPTTGLEIRKITDNARASVLATLKAKGVTSIFRRPFADGFDVGLNQEYLHYAEQLERTETGTTQIG